MKTPLRSAHFLSLPLLLLVLGAGAVLRAQPLAGRVLLYTEPKFRGESLIVPVDTVIENLELVRDSRGRPFNNRVRSFRVEGPVRVTFFEDSLFRGAVLVLTRDVGDLGEVSLGERSADTWDRTLSSLRVEPQLSDAPPFFAWNRRDADRAITAAYRDILGREPDDLGYRHYRSRLLDAGWSQEQLRDALRDSDEFRHRDIGAIVRRAYTQVLGRDADPAGLASYTRALQRGMSEGQLRAELLHSREGTERAARELVTRAYRAVLKRDPDPAGLATYMKSVIERGWDENRVVEALRRSDEYRNLGRR